MDEAKGVTTTILSSILGAGPTADRRKEIVSRTSMNVGGW